MKGSNISVRIRWMLTDKDLPEVLAIEKQNFEFPWLKEDFIHNLNHRNCIGYVAEHEVQVVGFMIYELHKTRIHLLNFAVATDFQRRGIGSQMIAKLTAKLSLQRRTCIKLAVRETNLPAQLFFQNNGFLAVSVLRNLYADLPEDTFLMQYRLNPSSVKQLTSS